MTQEEDCQTSALIADAGVYVLTIRAPRSFEAVIRGGKEKFRAGWYTYIGRALRGLSGRLTRHLRTSRFRHWHVDNLLANGHVVDVQVRLTTAPEDECRTAEEVGRWTAAEKVPKFGASDCSCPTHLYHFPRRPSGSLLARTVAPRLPDMFSHLDDLWENHALFDRDPFATLVTCILSLRTQDPVTHAASERLFAVFRTPTQFATADPDRIAERIFPVGMYRQKSRRLIQIARQLLDRHDGEVPADIEALTTLPGVGRKTANLVRSFSFHLPALCVDTHVHRITNRWGLVRTATPEDTETELRALLPRRYWIAINPLLVQHGQNICRPLAPRCDRCPLAGLCEFPRVRIERDWLTAHVLNAPDHPSLKHFRENARGTAAGKE